MMFVVVRFDSALPSPKTILEKLSANTGLSIDLDEGKERFFCSELNAEIYFYFEENTIHIVSRSIDAKYFLKAFFATLIDLGGKYEGIIPDWAHKKWKDINWLKRFFLQSLVILFIFTPIHLFL